MAEDDESRAISLLIERLALRFPHVRREVVEETVAAAHRRLDAARIRKFVPVLVEHDVLGQLRKNVGHADGPQPGGTGEPAAKA